MKYSEKDLAALISEVEDEFSKHLAKAEEQQKVETTEVVAEEVVEKSEESFDYDQEDVEEMNKLYADMSKNEKEAHYKSVKKALFGDVEFSEEKVNKSEAVETVETISKSEYENLQKENEGLKKSLEGLTSALNGFLKGQAPKQKAVTQIQYVKKSEEGQEKDLGSLSRDQVASILSTKIRKGEIKKNEDKEMINAFYLENKSIETIKHLL